MREIPNNALTIADVPEEAADLSSIFTFALSFNGYKAWGRGECAKIANSRRHGSLTDLRTCLFFEQRRWHHFGYEPDEAAVTYFRDLVKRIREHVARGDFA
ncbi:MAG: hypothetical protein AB7G28_21240 [Pirellulales bacterium]